MSLHADVAWRLAIPKEHFATVGPTILPGATDRAPWKFTPTEFVGGVRLAFAIAVTREALMPQEMSPNDVHVAVEDRWDRVAVGYVWMTERGVDLPPFDRLVAGPLPLASGRRVWLTADSEVVPGIEPQPIPAGTMIEPQWPEAHGVGSPGLMVRAVNNA